MMNGAVNLFAAWTGFILGVVVLTTAAHFSCVYLTQRWRAPRSATMNVQLNRWMIPLIIAFIAAWKMSRWVESDVAGWIAGWIASAAMGTAYGQGLADGQRASRTESKDE
jgi:hypothetical protein